MRRKFLFLIAIPVALLTLLGSQAFTFSQAGNALAADLESVDYVIPASAATAAAGAYMATARALGGQTQSEQITAKNSSLPQWFIGNTATAVTTAGDLLYVNANASTSTRDGVSRAAVQRIYVTGRMTNLAEVHARYGDCTIPLAVWRSTDQGQSWTEYTQRLRGEDGGHPDHIDCTTGSFSFNALTGTASDGRTSDVQYAVTAEAGGSVSTVSSDATVAPEFVFDGKPIAFVTTGDAPTVTSVSPITGTAAGGTLLTIRGTNFGLSSFASVGDDDCTDLVVVDDTMIQCSTSRHPAGPVDVVVYNSDWQNSTLPTSFEYQLIPTTVTASSPSAITYGSSVPTITYSTSPSTVAADWSTLPTCGVYSAADTGFATPLTGIQPAGTYVTRCSGGVSVYNLESTVVAGSLTINKATSTTVLTCPSSMTYTGSALTPCSTSVTGANGLSLTPAPNYSDNTTVGTASVSYTYAGDANHTGSSDSTTFAITKAASATVVSCPSSVTYTGSALTPCTVAVTGAALSLTPSPTYATNTNAGTASAAYTYAGDANHTGSSDSTTFTIDQAASATTVTCTPSVYSGSAKTTCSVEVTGAGGLSLTPTPNYTSNVNAGTARASYTYIGDANHTGSSGSSTFDISRATSTTSVSCPAIVTYTGSPLTPCSVTVVGAGGLSLTPTATYRNNTESGTATATYSYAGDDNHDASSGTTTFVIDQASVGASISCPAVNVYTGSAITDCSLTVTVPTFTNSIDVGSNPVGTLVSNGYVWVTSGYGSGSAGLVKKVDAATGTVVTSTTVGVNPSGLASDGTYLWVLNNESNPTGSLSKVRQSDGVVMDTVSLPCTGDAGRVAYDGVRLWVTCPNADRLIRVRASDGVITGNYATGDYPYYVTYGNGYVYVANESDDTVSEFSLGGVITRTFTGLDHPDGMVVSGGYLWVTNGSSSATNGTAGAVYKVNLTSGATVATVNVGDVPHSVVAQGGYLWVSNYGGSTITKVNPSSNTVDSTIGPAVGSYTLSGPQDISGDGSYLWVSNMDSGRLIRIGTSTSNTPTITYSNNVNAGIATATYTYPGDANHVVETATVNFTISPASSTTTVTCPASVEYTGAARTPCSVSVTGAGGLSLTPTPTYSSNTAIGTASASYSYAGDANHSGSSGSTTFDITKASSVTTVTCPINPLTYDGAAHTPCTVTVTSAAGLSLTPTPDYTDNINAGTVTVTYTYAGNATHLGSSGSSTFTITQATSSTVVTCPASETYTGSPLTPCTVSVTGAGGLNLAPNADYADNTAVGTATASYTYGGDTNHTGSSDSTTFEITP